MNNKIDFLRDSKILSNFSLFVVCLKKPVPVLHNKLKTCRILWHMLFLLAILAVLKMILTCNEFQITYISIIIIPFISSNIG